MIVIVVAAALFILIVIGVLLFYGLLGGALVVAGLTGHKKPPQVTPKTDMSLAAVNERAKKLAAARARNPWLPPTPELPLTTQQRQEVIRARRLAEARKRYPWLPK